MNAHVRIVRQAVIKALADETTTAIIQGVHVGLRKLRQRRLRNSTMPTLDLYRPEGVSKRQHALNVGRQVDEAHERRVERLRLKQEGTRTESTPAQYHDVIMVAFDIRGESLVDAQDALIRLMPHADFTYNGMNGQMYLDSWWIANDDRIDGSDCDSAVFVKKGRQEVARETLRLHGHSNN